MQQGAGDVDLELPHGRPELAQLGIATVESVEIEQQIIDDLPSAIRVAVPEEPLDPAQLIQSRHPGLLVMVHQSLGELPQDRDPHSNVEPVEDVLAARTDPLGEGADLLTAVCDKGQILIGLEALLAEMINDATLRLAVIAMNEADVPSLSLFGHGPVDDELEVPLSVAPIADVAAVQADSHPSIGDRQIIPTARVWALGEGGSLFSEIALYPLGCPQDVLTYRGRVDAAPDRQDIGQEIGGCRIGHE